MRFKYLAQDANARLDEGICFYGGRPFVIRTRDGNGTTAALTQLHGRAKPVVVNLVDNELLDISAPELGYINHNNRAYYVMRAPNRVYKQTLQTTTLTGYRCGEERLLTGDHIHEALFSKAGEDMLLNIYPTLDEALAFINSKDRGKSESIAFHRDVALLKDSFGIVRVYLKGEEVGRIKPKTKTVIIPSGTFAWVISKYLHNFDWEVK